MNSNNNNNNNNNDSGEFAASSSTRGQNSNNGGARQRPSGHSGAGKYKGSSSSSNRYFNRQAADDGGGDGVDDGGSGNYYRRGDYNRAGERNNNYGTRQHNGHDHNRRYTNNHHNHNHNSREGKERTVDFKTKPKEEAKNDRDAVSESVNRRRFMSVNSEGAVTCICCCHELHTFVYYTCKHFVCLHCSVKMRVLCDKIDCPVCRQDSENVYCTKSHILESDQGFEELSKKCHQVTNQVVAGIYYDDVLIRRECDEILACKCDICRDIDAFDDFDKLDRHMRRVHERFYCELCIENLKLFPYERKHYSRKELGQHQRVGDKDDSSFKGHPNCDYCDQRFFDKDALYKHFRRDHYYCHFCDIDGHEQYYKDYAQLRTHFLKCHYLCELDGCSSNAAQTHEYVVFRTDLDFQVHKKQKHAKNKSESKNLSKLNIEFTLNNSARDRYKRGGGGGGGPTSSSKASDRLAANADELDEDYEAASARPRMSKKPSQSKLQMTDIEPHVLRMSREQFERDEQERIKQQKIEKLKEQYKNYENSQPQIAAKEETDQPTSSVLTPVAAVAAEPVNEPVSTWRNVIGQGNAPKIDRETEFPSLANSKPAEFMSLAELGASIGSTSRSNNAWASKKTEPSQQQAKKPDQADNTLSKKSKKSKQKNKTNKTETEPETHDTTTTTISTPEPPVSKPQFISSSQPVSSTTVLPAQPQSPAAPPGFESMAISKPPTVIGPPPGFQSINQPKPTADFLKPVDYEMRNQQLGLKLSQLLQSDSKNLFEQFKNYSIEFKNSKLNAEEYFEKCHRLFEDESLFKRVTPEQHEKYIKFLELVQEMIVLLPDVDKQSQLFDAYLKLIDPKQLNTTWVEKAGKGARPSQSNAVNVINRLVRCTTCDQFLFNTEINEHNFLNHKTTIPSKAVTGGGNGKTKQDEFPALSSTSVTSIAASTSSNLMSNLIASNQTSAAVATSPKTKPKAKQLVEPEDEFPALGLGIVNTENRFSTMPTASLFSNPSSHLSLVNKKKNRFKK